MSEKIYRAYCKDEECDWSMEINESYARWPRNFMKSVAGAHSTRKIDCWAVVEIEGEVDDDGSVGTGMRLCGVKESEKELQEWLEHEFEENGWTAVREVRPRRSDVAADLIVCHDDFGWFGVEAKYFESDGGSKAAVAHHQITRKYRGQKYLGRKIDLWGICPYFSTSEPGDHYHNYGRFIREFFCRHGIAYLGLNRADFLMDFAYSDSNMKVPINSSKDKYQSPDVDRIRESVGRKMEKYDYK